MVMSMVQEFVGLGVVGCNSLPASRALVVVLVVGGFVVGLAFASEPKEIKS